MEEAYSRASLITALYVAMSVSFCLPHPTSCKNCFRIARQMAREGRDVISVCCMENDTGNVVSDADGMKNIWRKYMEKLLNVENDWDGKVDCPEVMGLRCLISEEEMQQLLKD